jgi:hypothetical protein
VNAPRLAHLAAKILRQHRGPAADQIGDRARTVAALERALAVRSRRRWPLPLALAAGAAAAAAATLIGLRLLAPSPHPITAQMTAGGTTSFVRAGARGEYRAAEAVLAGDRLHTRAAAQLALSTGTTIAMAPESDLDVVELGDHQRLSLSAGHLRARVKKLGPLQGFSVTTPDAVVSVRGTEFDVDVGPDAGCGGRTATWVQVFEGVVEVDHAGTQTQLLPAQIWSTPCPAQAASPPPVAPAPVAARPSRTITLRSADRLPVVAPTSTSTSTSTLTEQNDLFEQAIVARRLGDRTTALRKLDTLLARFPDGPLAAPAARARHDLAFAPP